MTHPSNLPRAIEPPRDLWPGIRRRINARERRAVRALAAAAVLALAVSGTLLVRALRAPAWEVAVLAGAPRIGSHAIAGRGAIRAGDWLVTDHASRARVAVGDIGRLDVEPDTRIRLLTARADDHRFGLERGAIAAVVSAPPRLFFVETPGGTAIDLGCAYTMTVDSAGRGITHVTAGYVEFDWNRRRAIVPVGASIETRRGVGPGTPSYDDAPAALREALQAFDFAAGGAAALHRALAAARAQDALSLWHLLSRADSANRAAVYDRLAGFVPPPAGVTRAAALALDSTALRHWWDAIDAREWRRVFPTGPRTLPR